MYQSSEAGRIHMDNHSSRPGYTKRYLVAIVNSVKSASRIILVLVAVIFAAWVGITFQAWSLRSARFDAFVRMVREDGGHVHDYSKSGVSADRVKINAGTNIERLNELLSLSSSGNINQLDLADTTITSDQLYSSESWPETSIDRVIFSDSN